MKMMINKRIEHFLKGIYLKAAHLILSINEYKPLKKIPPKMLITVPSAWVGLELIIEDILDRYKIERGNCIEFGVEWGYSTAVFANYFNNVIGIDTFEGDDFTGNKVNHLKETKENLSSFSNIKLIQSDYKDWIKSDNNRYNFCHIDIVHNYKETFECGLWAANHCDCIIFHDTERFLQVRKAVIDISRLTKKQLFNYPFCNGLGILIS
jgi:hypothetical protein